MQGLAFCGLRHRGDGLAIGIAEPRKAAPKTSEELSAKIPESDEDEEDFTWDDDEEEAAEIVDKEDIKEADRN